MNRRKLPTNEKRFSDAKQFIFVDIKQKHHQHHHSKSKLGCFGAHQFEDIEGAPIAIIPSLPPREDIKPISSEAGNNGQSKQAFSLVLATAVAAGAAVAGAADIARVTNTPRSNRKLNLDMAATKIQSVYRGYLARKYMRGLRGLARLKTLVQGQSVQRQAATTLQCMQTLSRLQSQVRARKVRMSEENQTLQRQMQRKREKEFEKWQANQQNGEKWDDSSKSKEQVDAKNLNRQIAAMRREKAMAYASTHQQTWRNNPKSATNATFMDPNNPHWGWNWLERWMAARPWEGQNTTYHIGHASAKSVASQTMSVGEITKLYSLRDQNNDMNINSSPQNQKPTRPTTTSKAPLANGTKAKVPSPRTGSWGGDGDSKSLFIQAKENNRRHSIGVSPVGDDESHSSSSPTTKVAKKGKTSSSSSVRSASVGVHRNGTPEKSASASASAPLKKRLSFPASPAAGTRRPGNVASNKTVAKR